jgi:hypothetical protein
MTRVLAPTRLVVGACEARGMALVLPPVATRLVCCAAVVAIRPRHLPPPPR